MRRSSRLERRIIVFRCALCRNYPTEWRVSQSVSRKPGESCLTPQSFSSMSLHQVMVVVVVLFTMLNMAALMIWAERRLLAAFQDRLGPNRAGPFGLFIVAADMIKIFTKEDWIPPFADKVIFVIAPAIILVTTLLSFAVVPFAPGISVLDLDVGLLFFLAMSSMGIY